MVDATAAYFTLADETEHSPLLMHTHHLLLGEDRFRLAAATCDVVHASGDVNIAGDAASRSKWEILHALASAMRIRAQRVEVPSVCLQLYQRVLSYAVARGVEVRHGSTPSTRPLPRPATTLLTQAEGAIQRCGPALASSSSGLLPQEVIEHVSGFLSSLRSLQHVHAGHADSPGSSTATSFLQALQRRGGTPLPLPRSPARVIAKLPRPGIQTKRAAMQTSLVEGVRLATHKCPRPPSSDPRRLSRDADALLAASRRAQSMAAPSASAEQRARSVAVLAHASSLAQFGAAETTLKQDDCAWAHWREFSDVYGFDPVVSRNEAPDQFGEEHCTFPSVMLYDGTATCAASATRDTELESPCHGTARKTAPLFADEHGSPYTYYVLNSWLRKLLTALFGAQPASAFSWHSFRIELACLLRAAGVLTASTLFDAVRTNNMVALDNADSYAHLESGALAAHQVTLSLPSVRSRVEVQWHDEWFAGVVTSRRHGCNTTGKPASLYRVMYDATDDNRSHHAWHDLSEVRWRALPSA
ncbi:MAG: hypothetical protein SGPRY_010423 [Prymnesium sp.]